jgi:hypothetical protein
MEYYPMNDFSVDSFDMNAGFAISQAMDADMLYGNCFPTRSI